MENKRIKLWVDAANEGGETEAYTLVREVGGDVLYLGEISNLFFQHVFWVRAQNNGLEKCRVERVKKFQFLPNSFFLQPRDGVPIATAFIRLGNYGDPNVPEPEPDHLTGLIIEFQVNQIEGISFNEVASTDGFEGRLRLEMPFKMKRSKGVYLLSDGEEEWRFAADSWTCIRRPGQNIDYLDSDRFRDALPELNI